MDMDWDWHGSPPNFGLELPARAGITEIQVIEGVPPKLDQLAVKLGTSYKQVWGTMSLWGNGKIPDTLVRNSLVRMKNSANAFVQACAAYSIECADIPPNTEFAYALAEHCLTQPASPAVTDTFGRILQEHGTPYALYQISMEKVAIWREKTGQPAIPAASAPDP